MDLLISKLKLRVVYTLFKIHNKEEIRLKTLQVLNIVYLANHLDFQAIKVNWQKQGISKMEVTVKLFN